MYILTAYWVRTHLSAYLFLYSVLSMLIISYSYTVLTTPYFIHICTYLSVLCTYVLQHGDLTHGFSPIALLLGRLVRGGLSLLSPHRESPLALSSGGVADVWSWYYL